MIRQLLLLALLILTFSPAQAWMLKGTVTDEAGEPLPYANVYLKNTTIGVVTNLKGQYFLELDKGDYTIVFQSLSYQKKSVEVQITGNQTLDITLLPEDVQIEEIQVTAGRKDPAYAIMQKVIENKKQYIRQFESYQCETYLKVSLESELPPYQPKPESDKKKKRRSKSKTDSDSTATDSLALDSLSLPDADSLTSDSIVIDTLPVDTVVLDSNGNPVPVDSTAQDSAKSRTKLNFIEQFSTTYFQRPGQWKSVVHAFRDMTENRRRGTMMTVGPDGFEAKEWQATPSNPYLFYRDISEVDFNFYENLISATKLGDRLFISPLSSTSWRITYKYKLEEQFMENGRVIYKIKVTPRLKYGPYFEGHLYIVDDIWAIKSVNLKIVPATLSFFNYFQVLHSYEMTDDNRWVLAKEDYYYNTKEGKNTFYGNSVALHTEHKLDVEFPKRHFKNELRRVETEARDLDSTWWDAKRPVTLKRAERQFITERDSIIAYRTSDEYIHRQDSLFNLIKFWDPFVDGVGIRRRKRGMEYFINPILSQLRPFGVGGYRHAPGGYVSKEWKNYKKLYVSGELDYGFATRDIRGNAKVAFTYQPEKFASAYVKYGNRYALINNNATIIALLSRGNYILEKTYGFGQEREILNGLRLSVGVEQTTYEAIDDIQLTQWSQDLFGANNTPQSFTNFSQSKIEVRLTYVPGQKFYSEPNRKIILGSKWPTFTLQYNKAIPGIFNSTINYDFVELRARHEFRPGSMGVSRWSARTGTYLNQENIRFTDFQFFRGSDDYLMANPLKAFQLLGQTLATPNPYFQGNYLHDFGGALIDKIPLLNRTTLQTAAGGGVLFVDDQDFFHAELFAGLQLPLRIKGSRFKIGAYYNTSYTNKADALGSQIKFGIAFFDDFRNRWSY